MSRLVFKGNKGKLSTAEYEMVDDGECVGMIQIRHKPSHSEIVPPDFASHIYYEIELTKRNQGYGKEILKLGLKEARKMGLKEVILTCYADNTASKNIIETNGGKLIDNITLPKSNNRLFLKYKIKL